MMGNPFRSLDRQLRTLAYDVLSSRDKQSGWKPHREAFLVDISKDPESLVRGVDRRLQTILNHAYETSAYYRQTWGAMGFRPSANFRLEEFQNLPFLTKDIIKKEKMALVSKDFTSAELDLSYTGGTMGTQTSFYLDHACAIARQGRRWGMHQLCGYRPGMRRALVWGVQSDLPAPGLDGGIRRWFRKFASGDETLSCTVMSEHSMLEYHGRLVKFRPEVMYGYPSALTQLARFIEDKGLEPIRVRTIITTAERLGGANRRQLIRAYGAEVFNLYATREYGCIGFECGKHHGFHIDIGSVFVEIMRDGRLVEAGESGEIVITDLLNHGMPFIRSRTGDMGALSEEPCGCGSPLPVLKQLEGRSADVVYRPDGSVVPGLMLTDVFRDEDSIRFLQFVQQSPDQIDVLLVVTDSFTEEVRNEAVRQVREIMGDEIAVRIRLVDELERNSRSGKLREIVCTVDPLKLARPEGIPLNRE